MIGHIYITGYIGSFRDENGVEVKGIELIDVISAVQKNVLAERFNVYIKSKGGRVDTGYNIYSYLKSLKQPVTTIIDQECASIATVVASAGDERIMIKGSGFTIHNPWVGGVTGDADDLLSAAEGMRAEEDKMIDFYSELTGIGKEGLDALMKVETNLTEEKALELKFVTKVIGREEAEGLGLILAQVTAPQPKALAVIKPNEKKENTMSKEILSKLDQVLAFVGIKKEDKPVVKAMVVSDSNGVSLDIKKADGTEIEGKPASGDLVTADGKPAEGSYILPDMGLTIEVKAGVISSVTDTAKPDDAAAPNEELEQAKKDLTASQARVTELEEKVKEHENFKAEVETKFALIEKGLKASNSKYVPVGKTTEFREEKKDDKALVTKEALNKIKEDRKSKK